jgi:hypothetical protein
MSSPLTRSFASSNAVNGAISHLDEVTRLRKQVSLPLQLQLQKKEAELLKERALWEQKN